MYHDITIIIPTIDSNRYLIQCVSCIKKISSLIKIIIISDKKITDTQLFKHKFVKIIYSKKNLQYPERGILQFMKLKQILLDLLIVTHIRIKIG